MYLFLIRHGDALSIDKDPLRQLSPKGIQEISKIGNFLKKQQIRLDAIYHSEKSRSQQTAQMIANALEFKDAIEYQYCLNPDNNVNALCNWVDNLSSNCLLVGHLPNLGLLSNYLLTDQLKEISFDFPTGAMACFRMDSTVWLLEWFIRPDLT